MLSYQTFISSLLSENFQSSKNYSKARLTVYFPISRDSADFYKKLEIKLFNHLSSLPHLKTRLSIVRSFLSSLMIEIKDSVFKADHPVDSIAIFLSINKRPLGLDDLCLEKFIIPLHIDVQEEFCLQNLYCLDQLVFASNQDPRILALVFLRKKVTVYLIQRKKILNKYDFEKPYNYTDDSEYLNQFLGKRSVGGRNVSRKIVHGTGASNLERDYSRHDYDFIKTITDKIKSNYKTNGVNYTVIFNSKKISEFIEELYSEEKAFMGTTVLFGEIVPDDDNQVVARSWQIAMNSLEQFKDDNLEDSIENPAKFVTGWNDVTSAAREGRIESLFIDPEVVRPGFILNNRFIYSYPVAESQRVKNIVPWVVGSVLESSGRVFNIESKEMEEDINVAAKLRY